MKRTSFLRVLVGCLVAAGVPPALADLPDTIARLKPAIVIVGTYRATDSPRFRLRGTGFVVGNGNQVVTNAHVLPQATENQNDMSLVVQVRTGKHELSMRQATVLQVDQVHDLALLRIEGGPVQAVALGDSAAVREGQAVAFTGFPMGSVLGFVPVTHRAIVSAITPAVLPAPTARQLTDAAARGARAGAFDIFQLDGTAYPGNSGGPLFDPETGVVLGVVNMVLIKSTREAALERPSGITYAVPARFVVELLERAATR